MVRAARRVLEGVVEPLERDLRAVRRDLRARMGRGTRDGAGDGGPSRNYRREVGEHLAGARELVEALAEASAIIVPSSACETYGKRPMWVTCCWREPSGEASQTLPSLM